MKGAFDRRVAAARLEATEKRAQVLATIAEVRHRLDPKTVIAETASEAFDRVNRVLRDATVGATSRPWLLAAGATLFGIAISLRAHLAKAEQDEETEATKPPVKS